MLIAFKVFALATLKIISENTNSIANSSEVQKNCTKQEIRTTNSYNKKFNTNISVCVLFVVIPTGLEPHGAHLSFYSTLNFACLCT